MKRMVSLMIIVGFVIIQNSGNEIVISVNLQNSLKGQDRKH